MDGLHLPNIPSPRGVQRGAAPPFWASAEMTISAHPRASISVRRPSDPPLPSSPPARHLRGEENRIYHAGIISKPLPDNVESCAMVD